MAANSPHSLPLNSLSNQTSVDFNSSSSSSSINETFLHSVILSSVWFVLIITILCGTIGNLLVLYVYVNRNDNKTCTFFIKILAIVDLIICLVLAPLELYQITVGIRNEFLCKVYGFLNTHVLYSTFLITIIAFDRYFCICWPLYRIITTDRARSTVIVFGVLTSLFAIIPMKEYSTMEHSLYIHNNHSELLQLNLYDQPDAPVYAHVEHLKGDEFPIPFTLGNITKVKCSPRFSLHVQYAQFLNIYRLFHSALFALCMLTVFILYLFIYNAIYQRRRNRSKKFSTYRRILQSYLISTNKKSSTTQSNLRSSSCLSCWRKPSQETHAARTKSIEYLSKNETCQIRPSSNKLFLEVRGARGKRYSSISMTSMTYCTSGVWDDASPSNLMQSRMNSLAANQFCGTDRSSLRRPSTSTDESIIPLKTSPHLTVPNFQLEQQSTNDIEWRKSSVRKPSQSLLVRQHRPSDSFMQRKVSFCKNRFLQKEGQRQPIILVTTTTNPIGMIDQCILEDSPSINEIDQSSNTNHHQSTVMDQPRNSISSARRFSVFDNEAKLVFERQQRQERLANIRTTLTLFIVTATFLLMYLPSITISLFDIKPNEFREALFLLYYINSACNPLIYSFFNINFRNDIRRIYECQKREYFSRQ